MMLFLNFVFGTIVSLSCPVSTQCGKCLAIAVFKELEKRKTTRQTERNNQRANKETPGTGVEGLPIWADLLCTLS